MEITLNDIDKVSRLMGKDFSDEERVAVLKNLESCDIQACPGSGKTTAMVAKIVMLAQKLSGTNSGICALSHTNAARDEIEKSLGPFVSMIFKYPNFISTIQVFTDMFLAVPAYIEKYGKRPVVIDDETYERRAKKIFNRLPRKTSFFLDRQTGGDGAGYFANISCAFENQKLIYFDGQEEQPFRSGETTASYQDVFNLKQILTREGYLTYHDAFSFAHQYLKKYEGLTAALSRRFPVVFIDEMQDTDKYQLQLIEMIFNGKSVLQKFGDPNQAIYGHKSNSFQQTWTLSNPMPIRSSKRLSCSVARQIQNLGLVPQQIEGNPKLPDCPHTIILFDQSSLATVIPTFGDIIQGVGLSDGPFVALGAVGKPNPNPDHISITSYWPDFVNHRRINQTSVSFWGSINLAKNSIRQDGNFSNAREFMLSGISIIFRQLGIVSPTGIAFTVQVLQREIAKAGVENSVALNKILLSWCQVIYKIAPLDKQQIIADVDKIMGLLGFSLTQQQKTELADEYNETIVQTASGEQAIYNLYHHSDEIKVTIDTIHSAKGRTHQSTLLLETFYYQFDLEQLVPYLHGIRLLKPGARIINRYLPLAYVACTRPTHLLCLAIRRDHVTDEKRRLLEESSWTIKDITLGN